MNVNRQEWWYEQNGDQRGPVGSADVERLLADGILKKENLVWKEGMENWIPLGESDFSSFFKKDAPQAIQTTKTGELNTSSERKLWKRSFVLLGLLLFACFTAMFLYHENKGKAISEEGIIKTYYNSGALESEYTYVQGIEDGVRKTYYENGKLKVKRGVKNGLGVGEYREYYPDGKIKVESNWKNGEPDGEVKNYYENGQIQLIENYKNGKPDGAKKGYYENGQLQWEADFRNGKQVGAMKNYYENGQPK